MLPNPTQQLKTIKELTSHITYDIASEYMILTYFIFKLSKQVFM